MMKALQSLTMFAAAAVALAGSPLSSDARGITARSGSSSFFADAGCWSPFGPTMTNASCAGFKPWHIPLVLDGSFTGWYTATVTATAVGAAGNVNCQLMSSDKNGTTIMISGFVPMPFFNAPADINLSVWVPGGGTAMLDCFVNQGSRVHTVNF
jgi:hypothetical protein